MINVIENDRGQNNSRVCTVTINSKKILTPFYFPSITSAETRSGIGTTIMDIINVRYASILVSCYDLSKMPKEDKDVIIPKLDEYFFNGGIVLLDSGEFENFHFDGQWNFTKYEETIKKINSDFFMSFDRTTIPDYTQNMIDDFSKQYVPKSIQITNNKECIAICHAKEFVNMKNSIKKILEQNNNLQIIAVPERECGSTIKEHCETIIDMRKAIEESGRNIIIHVLGCGNPVSIATLSYAGADTFDAVDWCRWLINPKNCEYGNLAFIETLDCTCTYCLQNIANAKKRAWRHNLNFYFYFLKRLRESIKVKKSLEEFLKNENIDQSVISNLVKLF